MRDGRPSLTASIVAAARGIGAPPADPIAADLLPGRLAPWVRAASRAPAPLLFAASLGLTDHMTLRTRAIDEALREALAVAAAQGEPLEQVVILGAGLDARGFRLPELGDAIVYEVDHPGTQAYKRSRIGDLTPAAREVRFVGVDFERMNLADALGEAGHRDGKRTFWIWEGVTPYLHMPAIRATLETIGQRSARGSRAAITYGTPEMTPLGPLVGIAAIQAFRLLGEPLHGLIAPRQLHGELEAVAFRVLHDDGVRDWAARFGNPRARLLMADERLVIAERR